MRSLILPLALAVIALPAAAQEHGHGAHHGHHAGHGQPGTVPDGWQVRLDRGAPMDQVRFMSHDGYVHLILGPGGIFWRPEQTAAGAYTASATFTQNRAPRHPEAYGLLVGGRDLDGPGQDYLYFLIRGDGQYLVKHRAGDDETHTLFDWTAHPAIHPQDAEGKATNTLSIQAGDFGARFLVNGTQVAELPRAPMLNTDGIVGLRVNHNLDVKVEDFEVAPLAP